MENIPKEDAAGETTVCIDGYQKEDAAMNYNLTDAALRAGAGRTNPYAAAGAAALAGANNSECECQ